MQTESTETNGTTTPAPEKVSAISKLVKAWRDKGSKLPEKKEQKVLIDSFRTLVAKRDEAQAALDKANAALAGHATKMVEGFGDYKIEIDGRKFFPASRGETVFYREEGKQDPGKVIKG